MTDPNPLFNLGQQSMLRIIRSARTRLGREHSVDNEKAKDSACIPLNAERPAKRASTSRTSAFEGAGRIRLTRSRSSLDHGRHGQGNSENAAPEKPPHPPAALGAGVLGDVTNVTKTSALTAVGGEAYEKAYVVMPQPTEQGLALAPVGANYTSAAEYSETEACHVDDPQYVMEYTPDIFRVMHREEVLLAATPGYMDRQVSVNAKMRGILVDWLVSVQLKYKLKAETLFLAISLIDRYLELRNTARRCLQLVGVTAMLIAAKFEEIYPPQINDFVYVTDKAYTKENIVKMEVIMLSVLDFRICRPTPLHFLDRYQLVNGCTEDHKSLAQYLLELSLVDYNMLKYSPSRMAAASILLSNKLLRRQPSWKPAVVKLTRFTEQMLKDCAKEMCALLESAEHGSLQAVRKKFSQSKYHSVAKINFLSPSISIPVEEAPPLAPRRSLSSVDPTSQQALLDKDIAPPSMDIVATLK